MNGYEYEYESCAFSFDFEDVDDGDEENREDVPLSPKFSASKNDLGGKKARAMDSLAYDVIREARLKVLPNGQIRSYDAELGYYKPVPVPEKLIAKLLSPSGHFSQLTVKDVRDLCQRIEWDPFAQCKADDFNRYETKINTLSGVLDFVDCELERHSTDKLFTYVVNAHYLMEPDSIHCPTFDQFCSTSLAPLYRRDEENCSAIIAEKRTLLLEIIGYACCDSNAGKCALFCKGEPDSGKSIVANFVTRLFPPELISNIPLHHLSDRFSKAELFGKKLNIAGEIRGKQLNEITTFKSITGGDAIFAEYKQKNPFSFTPQCKLLFAGNALPGTLEADATKAFTNRLIVLLFNHSIPKDQQDKHLLDKLWEERDSIFTLSMQALRELHYRNYRFTIPDESKCFLRSFANRGNSLQAFLHDCCVLDADARVHNVELLNAYADYCSENGLEAYTRQKFYEMLSGIPGVTTKRCRIDGKNKWGHVGIGLKKT